MRHYTILFIFLLSLCGCYKGFLEKKSDDTLVIPNDAQSIQALLDNTTIMNECLPVLGEISSDHYFVSDAEWSSYPVPWPKNAYRWSSDIYESVRTPPCYDWAHSYRVVFYSNIALQQAENQSGANWAAIRGAALFYRAFAFYQLLQIFAPVFDETTAPNDIGIPLRLDPSIDEPTARESVERGYRQITEDLRTALMLLPDSAATLYRPSKPAACALLARTYLSMGEYEMAREAAEACFQYKKDLLDYNSLNATLSYPVPALNKEVLFHATLFVEPFIASYQSILPSCYERYAEADLRKQVFFRMASGRIRFKGSYNGGSQFFGGLTSSETLLIHAECLARKGDVQGALNDLDSLRKYRIRSADYEPIVLAPEEEVLEYVLEERYKELICRGLRWTDIRRLNKEPAMRRTLNREISGITYSLPPLDKRYVLPIPEDVIELSGIIQNPR